MRVSVLIPFRGDGGRRTQLFNHVRRLWRATDFEISIGSDHGAAPFNVSRAFNDAADQATGDVFVLFGADQLPDVDQVHQAVAALGERAWVPLFSSTGAYSESSTNAILAGADPAFFGFEQWAPFCTGIIALTREAWDAVNGMDERFFGWGCEDVAFRMSLEVIHGPSDPLDGTLRCLHHPAAPRDRFDANAALVGGYQVAAAAGPGAMRALTAGNRP